MNFQLLKTPVVRQFDKMAEEQLFCTDVTKDELWETYLSSFPPGSNKLFRERTEHDCSCCRHFVKTAGALVTIVDGELQSIWDGTFSDPAYKAVARAMSKLVKSRAVKQPFLHYERQIGTNKNFEETGEGDTITTTTWEHFAVSISGRNNVSDFFCPKDKIATKLGKLRESHDMLAQALNEITRDAIDTVLDLMDQGSLYRGNEYKSNVRVFSNLKQTFDALTPSQRDAFVWRESQITTGTARIRGSAVGTLLDDLSKGMDLEAAVRRWETIMAPQNYKRTTALVTQAMVDKAWGTVAVLGLESAIERRHARLSDVSVNDVIFADRSARKVMRGNAFDAVPVKAPTPKNLDKVETVTIERFISDIVPKAESIEIMFDNKHVSNLVSIIAPQHKDAKQLFKWDNGFSWSYNGDVADSVKERVKRAGGNVTGDLCCRLAWSNLDDLDLHMFEPGGGHIFFGNRGRQSASGGELDVDMNAGKGTTREPVENIFYEDRQRMRVGAYGLFVHQYCKRENDNVGFEVEVDCLGDVTRFVYDKAVRLGEKVQVAEITANRAGFTVQGFLPSTTASKNVWGLKTQDFHRVSAMMLSPNYWSGQGSGNKHYFFVLDKCENDGFARGFYNEFLREELTPHRKVLEMVGAKSKVDPLTEQLSGLGFSSTQKNELLVRVKGSFTRTVKVVF